MRITVIDAFGNKHRVEIDTYVYEYPIMNLYRWSDTGIITELIENDEKKLARAELIGLFTEISGFFIGDEYENESKQGASGESPSTD